MGVGRRVEPLSAYSVKDFSGCFRFAAAILRNSNGAFGKSCNCCLLMPSLLRFLVVVAILAALLGAATIYLANFVHPSQREMIIRIPAAKFDKQP
jgi:hypothetical protein